MVDNDTIESYLIQMDIPFQSLREGMWQLDNEADNIPPVVVSHDAPIVYVRLKVADLPSGGHESLFRRLLELNAQDLAFGAYAISNGELVLVDTLWADTLDRAELQASFESLVMAAQAHFVELRPLLTGGE
ncbi:MAG: YbjN domain-containing protein [Fimbriimonadaceae bacterium]|nr:YbjN domain-containing protein [Fimbriimonadaceae bacterium]